MVGLGSRPRPSSPATIEVLLEVLVLLLGVLWEVLWEVHPLKLTI